jgi:hypothetical protein
MFGTGKVNFREIWLKRTGPETIVERDLVALIS